jgi:clan AA aspartic protease (TIGR02281 family)
MRKALILISFIFCFVIVQSQSAIQMQRSSGVFSLPCMVNGLNLHFILDTGASNVTISLTEAIFMLKHGYLQESDLIGTDYYSLANGDIIEGTKIILRELKVGDVTLRYIPAAIVHSMDAPLLLGQSAIEQFGVFQIDYSNNTLIVGRSFNQIMRPYQSAKQSPIAEVYREQRSQKQTEVKTETEKPKTKPEPVKTTPKHQTANTGTFTDSRDGNSYKWVKIGKQVWMAENLKYLPSVVGPATGSETIPYYYVYGYDGTNVNSAKNTNNYKTYGVLYNWTAAMANSTSSSTNPSRVKGVCPTDWHLPSDAEWEQLEKYLSNNGYNYDGSIGYDENPSSKIAKAMAATTHWGTSSNTGDVGNNLQLNNSSGFTALPGGYRNIVGNFSFIGNYGFWWSATENLTNYAWRRDMNYNYCNVSRYNVSKLLGFSVRCVRD